MKRLHVALSLLLASAVSVLPQLATSEEGGAGHLAPGTFATIIDQAPTQAGWVAQPIYLQYEGGASLGASLPFGGLIAAGVDAEVQAITMGAIYTFENLVFDAHLSSAVYFPYILEDVTASVTGPRGNTVRRTDSVEGLGDIILIPVMLAWESGENLQYDFLFNIYAPTGDYELGRLANEGLNYWTFAPSFGIKYNNDKTGFNAAVHTGFTFKTENEATNYESGTAWFIEGSLQQLLPAGPGFLGVGANAFHHQQITADRGGAPILGDFKGETSGIGPVLSYILPTENATIVSEFRWLPEMSTANRLEGDYYYLKFAIQFGSSSSPESSSGKSFFK